MWDTVRLGNHCTKIGSGVTPRGGDSVYQDAGTSFIRSQNVYNGDFSPDGLAFLTDEHAEQLKGVTVEKGDVLLNITGDSVARYCVVPDAVLPSRVSQHVTIIRPQTEDFDPRFLCYFLISPFTQRTMLSLAGGGGTRKALTKEMIERFDVPKPPRPTQERMVEILSAYDDLIENNRRRMALLEEAARQLYREWFVRLRFPGYEHRPIRDGVPEGWERRQLGEVATLNYGKALKSDSRFEGRVPVYGSSGVVGLHSEALVNGPGIVVGRKGNVGSVFWTDRAFWPIDTVYFIAPDESSLYLYYCLMNVPFQSSDVAVPGLNRTYAHGMKILVPSQRIRAYFDDFVAPLFAQMATLRTMNEKLRAARDLLLPRLMSGEVSA